jgi:hypothetical protein
VGAIGTIPGLKPVSRWLLALVIVVIVVNNYKKLVTGFEDAWKKSPTGDTAPAPTSGNTSAVGTGAQNPDFLAGLAQSIPFIN